MEGLLFGTLGTVGSLKPKKNKNKKKSKNTIKYHSDIENQIKNTTKKQARKVRESGFGDQFGELMMDNVDGPVAVNESQKTVNGFDLNLQRDLDFENDYSEFRNTEMHYGVKPKEELFTSNMQPFTSRREFDNGGFAAISHCLIPELLKNLFLN
jgi:hypothetical protein